MSDSTDLDIKTTRLSGVWLLLCFTLNWLLWNYRFVMVMSTGLSLEEKFQYIDRVLFPTLNPILLQGFFNPLATTLFFLIIYHPLTYLVSLYSGFFSAKKPIHLERLTQMKALEEQNTHLLQEVIELQARIEIQSTEMAKGGHSIGSAIGPVKDIQPNLDDFEQYHETKFQEEEKLRQEKQRQQTEELYKRRDTKKLIALQDSVKEARSHSRGLSDALLAKLLELACTPDQSTEDAQQKAEIIGIRFLRGFFQNLFSCEQKLYDLLICFVELKLTCLDHEDADGTILNAEAQRELTPKANQFNHCVANYQTDFEQLKTHVSMDLVGLIEEYFSELMSLKSIDQDFDSQPFTQRFVHLQRVRKLLLKQLDTAIITQ